MRTVITTQGISSITDAIVGSYTIRPVKYKLGSAYNVDTSDTNITDIVGNLVHQGESGLPLNGIVRFKKIAEDEVQCKVTLSDKIGDFRFGNILISLADDTPFLFATIVGEDPLVDYSYAKVRTKNTQELGNWVVFSLTIKLSQLANVLNVTVLFDGDCCNPEHVPTQHDLELEDPECDLYIVDRMLNTRGCSTLAFRDNYHNRMNVVQFTKPVESLNQGVLDLGIRGYENECAIEAHFGTYLSRARDIRIPGDLESNLPWQDYNAGAYTDTVILGDLSWHFGQY